MVNGLNLGLGIVLIILGSFLFYNVMFVKNNNSRNIDMGFSVMFFILGILNFWVAFLK